MARSDIDQALGLRFHVTVDKGEKDLGTWTKCDGLSVEWEFHEYKEGGLNTYTHRIPSRAKYTNLKLTRPVDQGSKTVTDWLRDLQKKVTRHTAEVSVITPDGDTLAQWNLTGVYPVRWTGPSLDTGSNQVATETLELSHNGFLEA
jgi:phage tail-like protein